MPRTRTCWAHARRTGTQPAPAPGPHPAPDPARTRTRACVRSADATADVDTLVAKFKEVIGDTWAKATTPNANSHVTEGHQRTQVPWREVARHMQRPGSDAPHEEVRRHVSSLTTSFFTWAA